VLGEGVRREGGCDCRSYRDRGRRRNCTNHAHGHRSGPAPISFPRLLEEGEGESVTPGWKEVGMIYRKQKVGKDLGGLSSSIGLKFVRRRRQERGNASQVDGAKPSDFFSLIARKREGNANK